MQTEQGLHKEYTVELRNNAKMRSDTKWGGGGNNSRKSFYSLLFLQLNLNRSKGKK